jgi:hypothetical protein
VPRKPDGFGWPRLAADEQARAEERRKLIAGAADEETHEAAAEWAERTAVEQGLPPRVMDIAVLRDVMRLMGLLKDEQPPAE